MGANVPTIEIRAHVARIAGSPAFGASERLRELLQHAVAESLAGRGASLKESVLGVTVFGRKPGYDSGANSIVRVEFARLRKKLQQYYETEGAEELLRVVFPKGSYAPEFVRTGGPTEPAFAGSSLCSLSLASAAIPMTNTLPMDSRMN